MSTQGISGAIIGGGKMRLEGKIVQYVGGR